MTKPAYVESEDHVPAPFDQLQQYNTSGHGDHEVMSNVTPAFEADKRNVAAEAAAALDPEDDSVPRDRVLLPSDTVTTTTATVNDDAARENLQKIAASYEKKPLVVGAANPNQQEAEKSGKEGGQAAEAEETKNVQETSTTGNTASKAPHTPDTSLGAQKSESKSTSTTTGTTGGTTASKAPHTLPGARK